MKDNSFKIVPFNPALKDSFNHGFKNTPVYILVNIIAMIPFLAIFSPIYIDLIGNIEGITWAVQMGAPEAIQGVVAQSIQSQIAFIIIGYLLIPFVNAYFFGVKAAYVNNKLEQRKNPLLNAWKEAGKKYVSLLGCTWMKILIYLAAGIGVFIIFFLVGLIFAAFNSVAALTIITIILYIAACIGALYMYYALTMSSISIIKEDKKAIDAMGHGFNVSKSRKFRLFFLQIILSIPLILSFIIYMIMAYASVNSGETSLLYLGMAIMMIVSFFNVPIIFTSFVVYYHKILEVNGKLSDAAIEEGFDDDSYNDAMQEINVVD
jgi:hypothetical protein